MNSRPGAGQLLGGLELPPKLHEPVAAQLARELVSGRIKPGEALSPEPDLASTYGISKTVVREAIATLSAARLIRVQHGKRTVVLPEEAWDVLSTLVADAFLAEGRAAELIESFYQVRLLIEPQATRWSTLSGDHHCEDLRRIVEEMDRAFERKAVADFLDLDRAFHIAIADPTGNRVLRAILRSIHGLVLSRWLFTELSTDDVRIALGHHREIVEAIVAGDADGAEEEMRAHLEWAARRDTEMLSFVRKE